MNHAEYCNPCEKYPLNLQTLNVTCTLETMPGVLLVRDVRFRPKNTNWSFKENTITSFPEVRCLI
jgi:hypothetical protein